jgi:lipopolysaccharide export system permease protein
VTEKVFPGNAGGAGRISSYLLRETVKPLLFSLLATLAALLLERTLRLMEQLTDQGGPLELVFRLTVNLLPHYLGLALPATFFISLFIVIARFDANNELVSISGTGLSLFRLVRPLVVIGVIFALISIALFGFLQPYSRYLYREIMHRVTSTVWSATLNERVFAKIGEDLIIYANNVDATGMRLNGVFIREYDGDREVVITAARGELQANNDFTRLQLNLKEGARTTFKNGGEEMTVSFSNVILGRDFPLDEGPFRPRGKDARELTLPELWRLMEETPKSLARAELSAEFHARLVRAASLPWLPMLAMAMGIAAKRASRSLGIVTGGLILVLYHHVIQLGGSLIGREIASPFLAIWLPFAVFSSLCLWTFYRSNATPGGNPFNAVFDWLESLFSRVSGALQPLTRRET